MKARIVERTAKDGSKCYVIQQRHGWFRWWWVDAWINSWAGAACRDSFPTLEEAQRNLCWFDGTTSTDRVIPITGGGGERLNKENEESRSGPKYNMRRDRPYDGSPHTSTGVRGATEIRGVTFRDLRDCFIRAMLLSSADISPMGLYDEAMKGEVAKLCEDDLYGWNLNKLDPMAVEQNLAVEIEKIMGVFPNVPPLIK